MLSNASLIVGSNLKVQLDTLIRTLITAGFSVSSAQRLPQHIEIKCWKGDAFGLSISYLFVLTDEEEFPQNLIDLVRQSYATQGKSIVFIAQNPGENWLGWDEVLEIMGGAVPSWRALSEDYANSLLTTATNKLPEGVEGEAWQLFEYAVADGLEYVLGHKVRKFGGTRRGQRVSDMIAQTSDDTLLVIDAKASQEPYGITMSELRPLIEYVQTQVKRQKGSIEVRSAVIVAKAFKQTTDTLIEVSQEFLSTTGVPLCCLTTEVLIEMVQHISKNPKLKNSIIWRKIFCRAGIVQIQTLKEEIKAASDQQVKRDL